MSTKERPTPREFPAASDHDANAATDCQSHNGLETTAHFGGLFPEGHKQHSLIGNDGIFIWNSTHFSGGTDIITDFRLDHDKLSFVDLLGNDSTSLDDALPQLVFSDTLSIAELSTEAMELHVNNHGATQTIEIHLAPGDAFSQADVEAFNSRTMTNAAETELIKQLISTSTGA